MDLRSILKALAPGFLPLLAYTLVEAVFGELVGLLAGLALGAGEFLYILIRQRRVDPFVLLDTGLLALAGGLSLALHDGVFFKLKPVVVELLIASAFGLALILPGDYLESYIRHQLKGIDFPPGSRPALMRSVSLMAVLLLLHAALTLAAALWMPTSVWGFISGGLLYILFGLVFLIQYLRARRLAGLPLLPGKGQRAPGSRTEARPSTAGPAPDSGLLPLVDEEGKVTGYSPASECHGSPGRLHPSVRLHITDGQGRLYLQKRAPSSSHDAGLWDSAVEGHVLAGESLDDALSRVLREGLGITTMNLHSAGGDPRPAFRYRSDSASQSELVHTFVAVYPGPFHPNAALYSAGRFWQSAEAERALGSGLFTADLEREIGLMLRPPEPSGGQEAVGAAP